MFPIKLCHSYFKTLKTHIQYLFWLLDFCFIISVVTEKLFFYFQRSSGPLLSFFCKIPLSYYHYNINTNNENNIINYGRFDKRFLMNNQRYSRSNAKNNVKELHTLIELDSSGVDYKPL